MIYLYRAKNLFTKGNDLYLNPVCPNEFESQLNAFCFTNPDEFQKQHLDEIEFTYLGQFDGASGLVALEEPFLVCSGRQVFLDISRALAIKRAEDATASKVVEEIDHGNR